MYEKNVHMEWTRTAEGRR